MKVIKVGGHELDSAAFLEGLAVLIQSLPERPVLVHGGGQGTTALLQRLGIPVHFEGGLRVTDDATLEAAVMGLVGTASTQLVSALVAHGVPALGLSGVDAALVQVAAVDPRLGWVGKPVQVAVDKLRSLSAAGFVPCLAPIALGLADHHLYNVNADDVAAAVAAALGAEQLLYLTNVAGIMVDGVKVPSATPSDLDRWISDGTIRDGMIPKVKAAGKALQEGVSEVMIASLSAPHDGTRIGRG